ncbi:MAG: hypothetical protein FWG07_08130 [Treponema sp.]|nr:hypothetical protein [Treponema sp.]
MRITEQEKINKNIMREIQVRRFICDKISAQRIDIFTSANGKEAFFIGVNYV